MRRSLLLGLCLAALGCPPAEPTVAPSATPRGKKPLAKLSPARLVPEIDVSQVEAWFSEEGLDKHLVAGLRIVTYEDGRVERANRRFERGDVQAVVMPPRLGGGYLFFQADGQGTRIWQADEWTGDLRGISFIGKAADGVLPGFDRLYVRLHDNDLLAIDHESGAILPHGPLPVSASFGAMTFADGWRGVVDTALRGPLATFDAGESWWPLGVAETIDAATTLDGDPVLYVTGGYYRLDARGHLQLVRREADPDEDEELEGDDDGATSPPRDRPLGRHPLRVAATRGFPVAGRAAVVAQEGNLYRVDLERGKVTATATDVIRDRGAVCSPAPVGSVDGFVCGAEDGPTTIYAFAPPLGLREVARFEDPRFVSPGGTGALAVRGSCSSDAAPSPDMRTYCIVGKDGQSREVAVRGEIGAERVIALDDGRTVVLVPPRLGRPGRITVIDGSKLSSHELSYPDKPRRAVKVARRGMWLEGFQQRGNKAVGGWVEAGGPVVGVTVGLDGKVKLGELREEGSELLASGELALLVGDLETGFESTDGGKTWEAFELPTLVTSQQDDPRRGCSRVGCALRGWVRVGWGEPKVKNDLATVDNPETHHVRQKVPPTMRLRCSLVSSDAPEGAMPSLGRDQNRGGWSMFLGHRPPALGKDDLGVGLNTGSHEPVPMQALAWGGRGADWTKSGWWQIRFDDRFATARSMRRSARTRSLFSDETAAADFLGTRRHGRNARWESVMDPAGRSAIMSRCQGSACRAFSVTAGRPILPLATAGGGMSPVSHVLDEGAVQIGDSWYLLTAPSDGWLDLWRSTLGTLRHVTRLRRLDPRLYPARGPLRLVRRAHGDGLGILAEEPPDPQSGLANGRWLVHPLSDDLESVGEPILLGATDLDGRLPRACEEEDDGWVVVSRPSSSPMAFLRGTTGRVESFELRLRLEPGASCVDGIAARSRRGLRESKQDEAEVPKGGAPLAVREDRGRRWFFRCE